MEEKRIDEEGAQPPVEWIKFWDAQVAEFIEWRDKKEAAASMVKLLNAPSPGLRVRGEGPDGPFEYEPFGWPVGWHRVGTPVPDSWLSPVHVDLIWALVSSGAAQVVEGEV